MRTFITALSLFLFSLSVLVFINAMNQTSPPSHDNNYIEKNLSPEQTSGGEFMVQEDGIQEKPEKKQARVSNERKKESDANAHIKQGKPPETQIAEIKEIPKERLIAMFQGEFFNSSQIVLDEDLVKKVQLIVREYKASPNYRIIVEGHTDNIPVRLPSIYFKDNMGLSIYRAKKIADILVQYGIPREKISVIGYGETRPVANNDTASGRTKNRRVDVKIIPNNKEF